MKKLIVLLSLLAIACAANMPAGERPPVIRIGSLVTVQDMFMLAEYYNLKEVADAIQAEPDAFKPFTFDGCSGLIDEWLGITGVNHTDITFQACLPHDLEYAVGKKGDELSRLEADGRFYDNLIRIGMDRKKAMVFYDAVRTFGGEEFGTSFSWGFARKK